MARRSPAFPSLPQLFTLCGSFLVVACATTAPRPTPPPPQPPVTIPAAPRPAPISKFEAFLAEARKTALAQGITGENFDAAQPALPPLPPSPP